MKRCDDCRFNQEPEYNKPCVVYRDDCPLYEKEGEEMTNKEVIEELKAIKSEYSDKNFHEARLMRSEHEALDMAIQALEKEPKWIPVSERLPKLREDEDDTFRSDNVLVWLSHEFDAENPMICYYFKYDEWEGFVPTALCKDWQDINSGLIHPIAWMPLPKPYEPQESEEV